MAKPLANVTPSEIVAEARTRFDGIKVLFEELARRLDPLESTNRELGIGLHDAKAMIESLEGRIGALRDIAFQLLRALGAASGRYPELAAEYQRLKQLAQEAE